MSDLTTVAQFVQGFYRLVGSESGDGALTLQGEAQDAVAYEALTRGARSAQLFMLDAGYQGWRKRSSAVTWLGADATDGGRYVALPSDALRIYGDAKPGRSALVTADGRRWGTQVEPEEDHRTGDGYYVRGEQLWLTRNASPPSTLYIDYHYIHPAWSSSLQDDDIDFPLTTRPIISPYAAEIAMEDNWLPGGLEMKAAISGAVARAEKEVRRFVRSSKRPRQFGRPTLLGNRY